MGDAGRDQRRKIYFIEKKFQTDFITRFCLLVAAGGLLTIMLVYWLASQATTVSIVNGRVVVRSAADFILPVLAQTVAVTLIFVGLATIAVALLYSHRIAGPLYRFKKVLEALQDGDFSGSFKIRSLDQLQMLAGVLANVVAKNRERLAAVKGRLESLEKKMEALAELSSEAQLGRVAELKAALKEIREALGHFKTS